MRYSNLHNHTVYSDGKNTALENVQAAIAKNMLSLGFSDHSFTACDPSYCMHLEQYEAYCREITALKAQFREQLPIYLGMELDYYSDMPQGDYDYIIASVHYIVHNGVTYPIDHSPQQQKDCIREVFDGDVLGMVQRYFDMLAEHVARIKPTFVGHFDVITKFSLMPEEDEAYRRIAREALQKIIPHCPYLEINTGGISRGWRETPYPAAYLLDTIRELGGRILLGADSHHIDNLTFRFDECVQLLKDHGFTEIWTFNGKTFDPVAI